MTAYPGGIYGLNQISNPQVEYAGAHTQNDSVAKNPIGGMIRRNGQLLRYVKHSVGSGTVTPVAGAPAYAKTFTPSATATAVPVFTVTADQSDSVMGLQPVGVYMEFTTAPTDGYYIWIIVGGKANALVLGAVAGDIAIGSVTDNQFVKISDSGTQTNVAMGRVCGNSSSGLSPTLLMNMDW